MNLKTSAKKKDSLNKPKIEQGVLDELFFNPEEMPKIVDSKQWNKLIEVLKNHKATLDYLVEKQRKAQEK